MATVYSSAKEAFEAIHRGSEWVRIAGDADQVQSYIDEVAPGWTRVFNWIYDVDGGRYRVVLITPVVA